MSLIDTGIEVGFVEIGDGCITVYPKRVLNSDMLKQVLTEAIERGYVATEDVAFNKPIVMKKKQRIDMTEVLVKLFALSASYGTNIKLQSFKDSGVVEIHFIYKGEVVTKRFDIEMLCAMEKDYVLGWFEEQLQKIDAEKRAGEKE